MKGRAMKRSGQIAVLCASLPAMSAAAGDASTLRQEIDRRAEAVMPKVVGWRRDFHQNPELGNREVRTSKIVAEHLRALGLEVKTGVAHTGVVALLRGGRPGPVVALRSDMDALPVTEDVDLPFRSTARAEYNGREVGVMHACGHDAHMAILMGTAEVLAGMRASLPGTVKFVFQPAEEGPPLGEEGGAALMVKQGALEDPKVDAIFGLHVFSVYESGVLAWRPRGLMAAADELSIKVRGRQTHGALPWRGTDPIVVAAQIVLGMQTLVSRQIDITNAPAIVTIGSIQGGNRGNIIPDEVLMVGTIRSFDPKMQDDLHERIRRTVKGIAESAGASAEVEIRRYAPVTFNDPALTARMDATLRRVAGGKALPDVNVTTTAEDFAVFQQQVPGLFFFLGVTPQGKDPATAAANHSPRFFVDEDALVVGVRALANLALDYMQPVRTP
jgi:amidohydrolase